MIADADQTASSVISNASASSVNTLQPISVFKTVKITKSEADGFGFNIIGGTDGPYIPGHTGIFFSRIRNSDLESKISEGDRIISVNDKSMEAITHDEAIEILGQLEGECEFKIQTNAERAIAMAMIFDTTPEGSTDCEEENFEISQNQIFAFKNTLIWGRGILPKGTGAEEEMTVNVDNCSEPVKIAVVKENKLIPHSIRQNLHQPFGAAHPRLSFIYTPPTSGIYEVMVMTKNGDLLLGKSPYKVNVGPKNSSRILAEGPGLEGGIAGEEAIFYVYTYGKTDRLEFAIEGPSETQIYCTDGGNGTAIVKYTPREPGLYTIKILELDTNKFIKNSPFVIWVDPPANSHSSSSQTFTGDAKMVKVSGRGLETFVPRKSAEFVVDTSNTGLNKLFIAVITSTGQTDMIIRNIGGNKYLVSYLVRYNAQAQIHIKYGDSNVPGSPFCVNPSTQIQNIGNGNGNNYCSIL